VAGLNGRQAKKCAQVLRSNGRCNGVRPRAELLGFNAVKMLFWSAVINGLLAPPLILLVILLTSNHKAMGKRVSPPLLRYLGWATFGIMTAAAAGMIITS
jgi:Mn2+/Fe2+ NRAMP family transporter